MITKEQALKLKSGDIVHQTLTRVRFDQSQNFVILPDGSHGYTLPKPYRWKVNGKIKLWKRNKEVFRLPLKRGLYEFGYIDSTNNHLFEVLPS